MPIHWKLLVLTWVKHCTKEVAFCLSLKTSLSAKQIIWNCVPSALLEVVRWQSTYESLNDTGIDLCNWSIVSELRISKLFTRFKNSWKMVICKQHVQSWRRCSELNQVSGFVLRTLFEIREIRLISINASLVGKRGCMFKKSWCTHAVKRLGNISLWKFRFGSNTLSIADNSHWYILHVNQINVNDWVCDLERAWRKRKGF